MYLLVSPYLVYSLSDSAIKPSMTAALLFFLSTFVFLSFLWLLLLVSLFCLPLSFSRFFGCCFSSLFSVYICLSLFSLAAASRLSLLTTSVFLSFLWLLLLVSLLCLHLSFSSLAAASRLYFLSTSVFLSFLWLLLLVSLFCLHLFFSLFFGCCFSSLFLFIPFVFVYFFSSLFSVYLLLSLFSFITASHLSFHPIPVCLSFLYIFSRPLFCLPLSTCVCILVRVYFLLSLSLCTSLNV
jgi:hypothetical protein